MGFWGHPSGRIAIAMTVRAAADAASRSCHQPSWVAPRLVGFILRERGAGFVEDPLNVLCG